jgi:spore maturation protein CgeB
MKVLFSSNKNPNFLTITEYIEKAFKKVNCTTIYFDNRSFIFPAQMRDRMPYLNTLDIKRMNNRLMSAIKSFSPDLFLEAGGHRILPETIVKIKELGVKTVLWTIDAPKEFEPIRRAALYYDFVFTGGSEAYDILKDVGVKNLSFLPFACDPDFHKPQRLTEEEKKLYGCDIAFVGTLNPDLYPFRMRILEEISSFGLKVWGPGTERIPVTSPLRQHIRGRQIPPDVWTKIYSQAKIVLCMHYKDPQGKIPCHQASPKVYEAMACGAFLMVDDQKDVKKLFKDREELVVFKDAHELRNLISYYLQMPKDRKSIAALGRKKVLKKHTYEHRIQELLKIISQ